MLSGKLVALRARQDSDVPVLHSGLHEDVATKCGSDARAWRPIAEAFSPYAVTDHADGRVAAFSIVELATGDLAGEAVLWNVDMHNRLGHAGLALLPGFRGRGLAGDVLQVLCHYGFGIRGLHRLQVETLVTNEPMIRTALGCGFVREGTLRDSAWVDGSFVDEAIFGLTDADWQAG